MVLLEAIVASIFLTEDLVSCPGNTRHKGAGIFMQRVSVGGCKQNA